MLLHRGPGIHLSFFAVSRGYRGRRQMDHAVGSHGHLVMVGCYQLHIHSCFVFGQPSIVIPDFDIFGELNQNCWEAMVGWEVDDRHNEQFEEEGLHDHPRALEQLLRRSDILEVENE